MKRISSACVLGFVLVFGILNFSGSLADSHTNSASIRFNYTGSYEKKGWGSSDPKPEQVDAVKRAAKMEAWKAFLRMGSQVVSQAERIQYEAKRDVIEGRLDEIVGIDGELQIRIDKDSKTIRVGGRAIIDKVLLRVITGEDTRTNKANQDIVLGYLVLLREEKGATSFAADKESSQGSTTRNMSERVLNEEISGNSSGVTERVVEGSKSSSESVVRSSGSETRRSEDSEYVVSDRQGTAENSLGASFSNLGFDAYKYTDIAAECGGPSFDDATNALLDRASANLSGKMRRGIFNATKECDGEYFILGTMDIDSITREQGRVRVSVVTNVEVYDLSRRIPKVVATIQAVRNEATRSEENIAMDAAIQKSTEVAGKRIAAAFANRQ